MITHPVLWHNKEVGLICEEKEGVIYETKRDARKGEVFTRKSHIGKGLEVAIGTEVLKDINRRNVRKIRILYISLEGKFTSYLTTLEDVVLKGIKINYDDGKGLEQNRWGTQIVFSLCDCEIEDPRQKKLVVKE